MSIGERAPAFSLRDQNRNVVTLEDIEGTPALIVFMPLAFTRVCGGEMCEIRDNHTELSDTGARTVVITCDNVPANTAWAEKEGFEFPILSDFWPHGEVTRAYGCFNDKLGVPHRATFVLDEAAVIREVISTDSLREARPFSSYIEALAAL